MVCSKSQKNRAWVWFLEKTGVSVLFPISHKPIKISKIQETVEHLQWIPKLTLVKSLWPHLTLTFIGWWVCATFEICEISNPYNILAFKLIKLLPEDILLILWISIDCENLNEIGLVVCSQNLKNMLWFNFQTGESVWCFSKYLKKQTKYQKSKEQLDITDKFQRIWYMNDLEGIWPWPSSVGEFQKNSFILKLNKIHSVAFLTGLLSFIVLKNFKKIGSVVYSKTLKNPAWVWDYLVSKWWKSIIVKVSYNISFSRWRHI